jgi:Family of unknown function (DUF6459)
MTIVEPAITPRPGAAGTVAADEVARGPRIRPMRYEPLPGEPCVALPLPPVPDAAASVPEPPARDERLGPTAHTVLRLLLEVLDGRRPAVQLAAHLAPGALRYVRAAGRRGSGRSRLSSVRICRPAEAAAEVAAVYRLDGRARAVAARFEREPDGTWRCVALRLG